MSRVKGKNTKPEIIVRKYLFSQGMRYRIHDKNLPGRPDIVLPKYKTIILIHGCFWHGHSGCKFAKLPSTREEFWFKKIARNKELDSSNKDTLKKMKWKVIEIWQCELKRNTERKLKSVLKKVKLNQQP